ncbi:hypothetical protein TUZN_0731 [Thermoproteus uzoniensis 768-20]|uniref:Uncharacterized protein n=1 Tax=Thermoproteus uzoniensis (strain 768-20) TaxID=999630 RepID=F2L4P3_THEU7|nr:hypothetical protein TUZN_0731 [Thermoproteus uzoniensis 768-20]
MGPAPAGSAPSGQLPTVKIRRLYVVGPVWLGDVAARRLNVSVVAIQLGDLPAVPNESVVLIYWPYLKANKSSLRYLESAIARGDLIAVYGNASDEAEAEYLLGYAWAEASNNRVINGTVWPGAALPDYLFAVPLIPVGSGEPVLYVVKWIRPRGLVIGPIYLDQLPKLVARLGADPATGPDPCLNEYKNFPKLATPSAGTYVGKNSTFIWAAPMLVGTSAAGVQAYADGNGTFYWDTCTTIGNYIYRVQAPNNNPTYYLPMQVIGYESYYESSTMYNNGGEVVRQLGAIDYYYGYQMYQNGITNVFIGDIGGGAFSPSEWNPPPTGSTSEYNIYFGISFRNGFIFPFIGVETTSPPGTSESISCSNSQSLTVYPNGVTVEVANLTWAFDIGQPASDSNFPNYFEDITPAALILPSFSQSNAYSAVFGIYFDNYVYTSTVISSSPSGICYNYITQNIWARVYWAIYIVPQLSGATSTSSNIVIRPQVPGTYISGISSGSTTPICIAGA